MFNRHRELLQPLTDFVTNRGRLPADDELADAMALREIFGSTRRAFLVVQRVTDKAQWDRIVEERAQDLLMYLALARFDGRPSYVRMSTEHQQHSTENQADAIRQYAERRGIDIVRTYADEGRSGLRLDGPGCAQAAHPRRPERQRRLRDDPRLRREPLGSVPGC
jgi:hypothetical protein